MTAPAEQERRDREADAIMRRLIARGLDPEAAYEQAKDDIDRRYAVSRLRWGETA